MTKEEMKALMAENGLRAGLLTMAALGMGTLGSIGFNALLQRPNCSKTIDQIACLIATVQP